MDVYLTTISPVPHAADMAFVRLHAAYGVPLALDGLDVPQSLEFYDPTDRPDMYGEDPGDYVPPTASTLRRTPTSDR